jgi:hypothetical protein
VNVKKVYHKLVSINSDVADEMLSKSNGNRSISSSRVDAYVREILAGNWRPYAGQIQFDENDVLINGHHRLNAFKKSGRTVEQSVMYGLPANSIDAIDLGRSRTVADALSLDGDARNIPNKNVFCAVTATCSTLLTGNTNPISTSLAKEFAKLLRDDGMSNLSRWTHSARQSKLPTHSMVVGCAMVLWLNDRSKSKQDYCDRVTQCMGEDGDPCRTVGVAIRREASTRRDRFSMLAKFCAGWPYYESKREMHRVYGNTVLAQEIVEAAHAGWGKMFIVNSSARGKKS